MSVTESKAKTERKSSRKPAKTQETVLSALLAQTEEVSVPLASLIKSPLNVRTVPYSAESVSELADSIKGVGLLQNLVVHALPGDRYGVAAGGRRLAALNMLAERDIIQVEGCRGEHIAGLVMTVLTVGLVSCAGKLLSRFWPGDFFPTFYACHLAVLGVLAL